MDESDIAVKFDELWAKILSVPSYVARKQLSKVFDNCYDVRDALSKEAVNCRRIGKITAHYTELEAELNRRIELLEQYITVALLIY